MGDSQFHGCPGGSVFMFVVGSVNKANIINSSYQLVINCIADLDLLINSKSYDKCLRLPSLTFLEQNGTQDWNKMKNLVHLPPLFGHNIVPFGVIYKKIGTIQRWVFL